jgi:outer membrane cobalamin receptor
MSRLKYILSGALVTLTLPALAAAPTEEILVKGQYPDQRLNENTSSVVTLTREDIIQAVAPRVDDLLSEIPGIGLFRRTDSRMAHPTSQGITIRNIGPNATGRTLVLLDGIPLNDPFAGSVAWGRLPLSSLQQIDIIRGGMAGSWGNTALGGVISMERRRIEKSGVELQGSIGNHETYDLSGLADGKFGDTSVEAGGSYYKSAGVYNLAPAVRGSIDRPLDLESYTGQISTAYRISNDTYLKVWGDYFHEKRGNGTPSARNGSRMAEAAASLVHAAGPRAVNWQFNSYIQDGKFESTFISVQASRATETPSLDQYNVPAHALGFSGAVTLPVFEGDRLEAGVDGRSLKGETREHYTFSNNAFQRNRVAGGAQDFTGGFLSYHWKPAETFEMSLTPRLDYWKNRDGKRIETIIATGAPLLTQYFQGDSGWQANVALAASYAASETLKFRANAYTGFRVPTINEFYRPFRVRNDITEANPHLANEKLKGLEGGIKWQPAEGITLDTGLFYNRLDNAVANVTLTTTPGLYAPLGIFVPAGGSLSQRQNLSRVNILGLEASTRLAVTKDLDLSLAYMYTHARVAGEVSQAALAGKQLAQVPAHEISAGLKWRPVPKAYMTLQGKYESNQFDDDLNQRRLGSFVQVDAGFGYRLSANAEIFAGVENLFNHANIAAVDASGLQSLSAPRLVHVGIRLSSFGPD